MRATSTDELKNFEIFSSLSHDELKKFQQHMFRRTYKKNQLLFTEGDPRERVYFLLDGYVKLERTNKEATMLYLDYVKPNDMFPYGGLFHDDFYHYSAFALTDIVVYYIPVRIFEEAVKAHKEQLLYVIKRLSKILEHHEIRLQTITTNNVKERVELAVTYLIKHYGFREGNHVIIDIPMTLTEIAKLSGASRETVSHVFKDLKNDQLLSTEFKHIVVYDPEYFLQKLQ